MHSAQTFALSIYTTVTGAAWILGIGLLIAGTAQDHRTLLIWGLVVTSGAIALASLLACHWMIDRAVHACANQTAEAVNAAVEQAVERTAILVGDAIAAGLAQPSDVDQGGVVSMYS